MYVNSRETSEALGNGASAIGTKFAGECDAALQGLGTKHHADLHLFNDNDYMRRNLLIGYRDVGHIPILPADPALQMTPSWMTKSEGN